MNAPYLSPYHNAYDESLKFPDRFWGRAAAAIHWHRPFERVLDDREGLELVDEHRLARAR